MAAKTDTWKGPLKARKAILEKKADNLRKKIEQGFDALTYRELNLTEYKIEVLEKRLSDQFFDPQAQFQNIEIMK